MSKRNLLGFVAAFFCLALLTSCTNPDTKSDTGKFIKDLGHWALIQQDPKPVDESPKVEDEVITAPKKDADGNLVRDKDKPQLEQVKYRCTTTKYTRQDNPEKIVMFSPSASAIWLGSLIQGKQFMNGGSLQELPIRQRAPFTITGSFLNEKPFAMVDKPDQASVQQAIGSLIAFAKGKGSSRTITYTFKKLNSIDEFALNAKASASYLGLKTKFAGSLDQKKSQTTVGFLYHEAMFTVSIPDPQRPDDFFSKDFTQTLLEEQKNLGRIGPDNIPVYISSITYGRIAMFTLTSHENEKNITAAIEAAYKGSFKAEFNLDAKDKTVLSESEVKVFTWGGDKTLNVADIQSGDWGNFFKEPEPIENAKPISYEFKYLDGTPAGINEATTYNVRECVPIVQPGPNEIFEFLPNQKLEQLPIGTPYNSLLADVNGDGQADLVLNSLKTGNKVLVGFGQKAGTFEFKDPSTGKFRYFKEFSTSIPTEYRVTAADINGDKKKDLVWYSNGGNGVYTSLGSEKDGLFEYLEPKFYKHSPTIPSMAKLVGISDLNEDKRDDLAWAAIHSEIDNASFDKVKGYLYVELSLGEGTFNQVIPQELEWRLPNNIMADDGSKTEYAFINHDNDSALDLAVIGWRRDNLWYVITAKGDGSGRFSAEQHNHDGGNILEFPETRRHLPFGNTFGDARTEWFHFWKNGSTDYQILATFDGWGDKTSTASVNLPKDQLPQVPPTSPGTNPTANLEWPDSEYTERLLTDLNGDGKVDVVFAGAKGNSGDDEYQEWIYPVLGGSAGFNTSKRYQVHPDVAGRSWKGYRLITGDIDGDSRNDLVWVNESVNPSILVALSRNTD
jgi:hypothetical protein